MACQVAVVFNTSKDAHPVTLSELRVQLSSNFRSLQIKHVESAESTLSTIMDAREEPDPSHPMAKSLLCEADLTFRPRQVRVFNVTVPLRDADTFSATGASLVLKAGTSSLEYIFSRPKDIQSQHWWFAADKRLTSKRIARSTPNVINVLPKPPRMQISLANLKEQYFTGEKIVLDIEISNEEDEETSVALVAKSSAEDDGYSPLVIAWRNNVADSTETGDDQRIEVGTMSSSTSLLQQLTFTAPVEASDYTLSVDVVYYLASNTETPISKTLNIKMTFVSAFESNYDLGPRLHEKEYPSFFNLTIQDPEKGQAAEGIEQRWCLTSRITSFASEPLVIDATTVVIKRISSNAICTLDPTTTSPSNPTTTLSALGTTTTTSHLTTQKLSLEDRRPSGLDLALSITWRRQSTPSSSATTTLLPVPILTLPAAEPRVLCTTTTTTVNPSPLEKTTTTIADDDGDDNENEHTITTLTYTLENPSMHFLTFTLTMEASDTFAFSGAKFRTVALTPLSRVAVTYTLLVYAAEQTVTAEVDEQGRKGRWIYPVLRVVDAYFGKNLRVLDAGAGVRSDGRGGVGVWVVGG